MTDKNAESRRPDEDEPKGLAIPGYSYGFPRIFEEFMRPFDELMAPLFQDMGSLWPEPGREPAIDIRDRGDHLVLTAELPGFEKKDVEVKIGSDSLELKAERRSENKSKNTEGAQMQTSRSYFHRYMTLPGKVVSEKATGTMKNGVLELKLPKKEPKAKDQPRRVDLK
jgi:HSP20 family protein